MGKGWGGELGGLGLRQSHGIQLEGEVVSGITALKGLKGQGRQAKASGRRGVFHVKGASVCVEGQDMVGLGLLKVSSWWMKGKHW